MAQNKLAFIFPPSPGEYPEDPFKNLTGFELIFRNFLSRATVFDSELASFDIRSRNLLDDELKTQYLSYIHSCSLASWFKEKDITPSYSCGYSMGIYGALFQADVISFTDGIYLLCKAFREIKKVTGANDFGMCSIIGMSHDDLESIIKRNKLHIRIAIQNSVCSFSLSGAYNDIRLMICKAADEGALSARMLNVTIPYHSEILNDTAIAFRETVNNVEFGAPSLPIVSLIDQKMLPNETSLREEVVRNLFLPLNWYHTQLFLQGLGVHHFVECGPGKGIVKNSRFIDGDSIFNNANSFVPAVLL